MMQLEHGQCEFEHEQRTGASETDLRELLCRCSGSGHLDVQPDGAGLGPSGTPHLTITTPASTSRDSALHLSLRLLK
jgi:hypothetical protein